MADADDLGPNPEPKALREAYERQVARNKALTDTLMDQTFRQAGIDYTKGLGATMRSAYSGDPNVEDVLSFAKERYEWEPKAPEPPPTPSPSQQLGETIAGSQTRIQTTGAETKPATGGADDIDAQIALAEKEGRWSESIALKTRKLTEMMGR